MPPRLSKPSQPFQDSSASLLRNLFRIPIVRASFVLTSILSIYFIYGSLHFYRDPGSIFFDENFAYERQYSALREQQGREWIRKQEELYPEHYSPAGLKTPAHNATICATFLTTTRPGVEPYLDLSIATFLDRLTPEERAQIHISVFFATSQPFHHQTYHRTWLRKVVDEVYTYADVLSPSELEDVTELEKTGSGLRKSPYDYTIPLRQCYEISKARYIGVFEDDIILAESWLARSLLSLKEMETTMRAQRRRGEWLYLRLFNQERSTGWKSKSIFGNELPKYWAYFGIPIALFLLIIRRRSRRWRYLMNNETIMLITLFFTPLYIIMYFKTGKATLMPPEPGLREEDFGCCAQGLLFNRFHVEHLADYMLIRQKDGYHDNLLSDYSRVFELARWSQYPMMIQHVGTNSSIQTDPKEAQRVWSMAFEELDPMRMADEHKELVQKLFGEGAGLDILRPTAKMIDATMSAARESMEEKKAEKKAKEEEAEEDQEEEEEEGEFEENEAERDI